MANRMAMLDSDLKECYNHDINWNLLPSELREVSKAYQQQASPPSMLNILFLCHHGHQWLTSWSILSLQICSLYGKGMKQRATTVSLGILTMISFCLGHASIEVNDFWTEPVITWIAVVLPTGKKSSINQQKAFRCHNFQTKVLVPHKHFVGFQYVILSKFKYYIFRSKN